MRPVEPAVEGPAERVLREEDAGHLVEQGQVLSGPGSQSQKVTKKVDVRSQSITTYAHKESYIYQNTYL